MATWGSQNKENNEQEVQQATPQGAEQVAEQLKAPSVAYIDQKTQEAMKEDKTVKDMAFKLLDKAKEIMSDIKSSEYDKWNKETKQTEKAPISLTHKGKDGEVKESKAVVSITKGDKGYIPSINIKNGADTLSLYAKNDMSDGVKFSSMQAGHWNNQEGHTDRFKGAENIVNNKALYASTRAAAEVASKYVEPAKEAVREQNPLKSFAYEANMAFKEAKESGRDIALKEDGSEVANGYAKYENDDYGERVDIRNHNDNSLVSLSFYQDKPVVKVTDFDTLNENGKPAQVYINNKEDADKYISNDVIKEQVSKFKGFDGNEQNKEADKGKAEHKKSKASVERD